MAQKIYASDPEWLRGTLSATHILGFNARAQSESKMIGNSQWYFTAAVAKVERYYAPSVTVFCKRNSTNLSCDSVITARLIGATSDNSITQNVCFAGGSLETSFTFNDFLPGNVLFNNNGFVVKETVQQYRTQNVITIDVEINVKEKLFGAQKTAKKLGTAYAHFFGPESPFAFDCVLIVEGKRLQVNKAFMSSQSGFFKVMFESDFREKYEKEIELKTVVYEEFLELLSVLYQPLQTIGVKNVECVLKLSDQFEILGIVQTCEQFLLDDNTIANEKKLMMAQTYHLQELLKHCASEYTCLADVQKLMNDYPSFDNETYKLLFDSLMKMK